MRNVSYCPAGGRSSLLAAVLASVRVLSLPLILQAVSFWSVPAAAQDAPVAPVRVIKDGPGSVAALLGSDIGGAPADFSPQGFFQGPIEIPETARYLKLPHRMDFEPYITDAIRIPVLDSAYVPLSIRTLRESTDEEVQEVAAIQLYRFAREGLADIAPAAEMLQQTYKASTSRRVRSACMRAAAAGNLQQLAPQILDFTKSASDSERVILEAALTKWKTAEAQPLWRERVVNDRESATSVSLACRGLVALGDSESSPALLKLAGDSTADYLKRMSAASAVASLAPADSVALAKTLANRAEAERLIAVALLENQDVAGLQLAVQLAQDSQAAVASAAWQLVFRQKLDLLQPLLAAGRVHREAYVRMTAARVMRALPDAERTSWLHQMLSDEHLLVRNVARGMLYEVAGEQPALKEQMISLCAGSLQPASQDWQGIEQSLVLLGQLRASTFSAQAVALLNYPRNEVMVSAAWLIHLFPDVSVRTGVLEAALDAEKWLYDPAERAREHGMKQAFLFEYLGIMRVKEIEETLAKQFNKGVPGVLERRVASMWALGLLYENNPDPALAARLHDRIQDRNSPNPERFPVRRACLLALGMMRSTASQPIVQESFEIDDVSERLRGAARWVHPLVGLALPPAIAPIEQPMGGWRLNPYSD